MTESGKPKVLYQISKGQPWSGAKHSAQYDHFAALLHRFEKVLTGAESLNIKQGTPDRSAIPHALHGIAHDNTSDADHAANRWEIVTSELDANGADLGVSWVEMGLTTDAVTEIELPAICPALNSRLIRLQVDVAPNAAGSIKTPPDAAAGVEEFYIASIAAAGHPNILNEDHLFCRGNAAASAWVPPTSKILSTETTIVNSYDSATGGFHNSFAYWVGSSTNINNIRFTVVAYGY